MNAVEKPWVPCWGLRYTYETEGLAPGGGTVALPEMTDGSKPNIVISLSLLLRLEDIIRERCGFKGWVAITSWQPVWCDVEPRERGGP